MHTPIEWEAFEHHPHQKSADWFWALGIVAVSITITSIFLGNILFGLFVLIAATTLAIHASHPPKILKVSINERGITIDRFHYPFNTLKAFWINNENHPALLLHSQRFFFPLVIVRLEDMDVEGVRQALLLFMEEKELHEPLLQKLAENFGF